MSNTPAHDTFFKHHAKLLIIKNIDDERFIPVVIELLNEEIHKYNSKAQKLYFLGKDKEAEAVETLAEFSLEVKKSLIKQQS